MRRKEQKAGRIRPIRPAPGRFPVRRPSRDERFDFRRRATARQPCREFIHSLAARLLLRRAFC
jgi:hypothetical protein